MTLRQCWKNSATGALIAAALTFLTPAAGETPRTADAARGKQLYLRHGCYGCHGFNGETGVRRLVGSPILVQPETFIAYLRLRADQQPLVPSTRMPSFPASSLSDADALDIYAYVRSFVLHAPDPKGIAAFQAILDSAHGTYKPRGEGPHKHPHDRHLDVLPACHVHRLQGGTGGHQGGMGGPGLHQSDLPGLLPSQQGDRPPLCRRGVWLDRAPGRGRRDQHQSQDWPAW